LKRQRSNHETFYRNKKLTSEEYLGYTIRNEDNLNNDGIDDLCIRMVLTLQDHQELSCKITYMIFGRNPTGNDDPGLMLTFL